ncbi:MAG: AsmA-like C-terminal region-containing protein [Verrucomicrobia bacterium]|nr:AsmA-like C-terminal region-containing protein [Verrucomicrobiota bacterium]
MRKKKHLTSQLKPLKWALVAGGLLAIFVFVGVFVVYLQVQSYLKSDAFRDHLISAAEDSLHAEIELNQLRWDGSTVYADGWRARGKAQAKFSSMNMDGLRALFNGTKNSAWQVPEIRINQLSVDFSDKRLPAATTSMPSDNSSTTPVSGVPGWLKKWIPEKAEIGIVVIDASNLTFHDKQGKQQLAFTSVETKSRPMTAPGTWEIDARNGQLSVRDLPVMSIREIETRWNHDEIFINRAELSFYDDAELSGTGDIKLGKSPELNLDLELANLDTKKILSAKWRNQISGSLHGDILVSGSPKSGGSLNIKGKLRLKDGVIEGLPMLNLIADYTKMQRFKRLALHKASADFVIKGNRIEVSNLILQSDGLTRLEGSFVIQDRQILNGQFLLGVTPGTLRWIPGAEQKVFTNSKNGFLWTPLEITGTLDAPQENLSARLTGAAVETLVKDIPIKAGDAAKKILNNPSDTINTGTDLLKSLIPLLK